MQTYKLEPTSGENIEFTGECLGVADDQLSGDTRTMEITIYRTEGGTLVGEIEYTTCFASEADERRVVVENSADDLLHALDAEAQYLVPPFHGDGEQRRAKALGIVRRLVARTMRNAGIMPVQRIA